MYVNYTLHYNKLIERAPKVRPANYLTEGHHIVPRCIGGTDADGIAYLTPEEHYIAHLLLVKMYPEEPKLVYAANAMSTYERNGRRINNKIYGWLRKKHSKIVKEALTGRPRPPEVIAKIKAAQKGKKMSEEHRRKISESNKRTYALKHNLL
jgi:hypothetical protein